MNFITNLRKYNYFRLSIIGIIKILIIKNNLDNIQKISKYK